jgi:hypothetical protein
METSNIGMQPNKHNLNVACIDNNKWKTNPEFSNSRVTKLIFINRLNKQIQECQYIHQHTAM